MGPNAHTLPPERAACYTERMMNVRAAWAMGLAAVAILGGCDRECDTDADCGDDAPICSLGGSCVECFVHDQCDDGVYCNGAERCEAALCKAGPAIDCGDRSGCGMVCDEARRACGPGDPDEDRDGADSMACGGTDCDDTDARRAPGAPEVCDTRHHDEDCDPTTFGIRDLDSDGWPDATCCNEYADGTRACGDDCDDTRADVHPASVEACDGRDTDCDGAIDEGVLVHVFRDQDGDGWGRGSRTVACAIDEGWAAIDGDCNDTNPQLHPGAFRCGGAGAAIDVCSEAGNWGESTCPGGGDCVVQPDGTGVCLPGVGTECSDGSDNDSDGFVDWDDPNCTSLDDDSERAARCDDGDDNDGDDATDYPFDPGCASREDTNETDPTTAPACANGVDDDSDGTRDWALGAGDPGCASAGDNSERDPDGPQCDNGIDDDMTAGIDCCAKFPTGDADCTSPLDNNEDVPACSNSVDDDGDGLTDFATDTGCADAMDDSERGAVVCDDGLDNDMDGAADFPGDTGCTDAADASE